MRIFATVIATLIALAGTGLLRAEMRSWTLVSNGKSIEAEYVDTDGDKVILLVRGKEKKVRLDKLSAEDQAYVREQAGKTEQHSENKNFADRWPTSTLMEDKLRARAMKEEDDSGSYVYETTHFRFISPAKLSLMTVSEMGRVFEGTYTACRSIPLNFPCRRFENATAEDDPGSEEQEKLVARLFLTQQDYAREVGDAYGRSAGLFREPEILVPFESLGIVKKGQSYAMESGRKLDTGTLIHELTHQMTLLGASYDVPVWFAEGMAEYMRLTTYKRGRFSFKGVHKNIIPYFVGGPGTSSRQLGKRISAPPLEQWLNTSVREFQATSGDQIQFNYGFSTLLAYYFIHLDGKGDAARLKRWMRNLQGTQRAKANLSVSVPVNATPEQIEAARRQLQQKALSIREEYYYEPLLDGRSWQELQEEFSKKVEKALGIRVSFTP